MIYSCDEKFFKDVSPDKAAKASSLFRLSTYPRKCTKSSENSGPKDWQKSPIWKHIKSSLFPLTLSRDFANDRYLKRQNPANGKMQMYIATARAVLESTVTPTNEALIRTHHPSLSHISTVYAVTEGSRNCMWVVFYTCFVHNHIKATHAGGREIQIVPRLERPNPMKKLLHQARPGMYDEE